MPEVEIANVPSNIGTPVEEDQSLESVATEDQPSATEEDASDSDK